MRLRHALAALAFAFPGLTAGAMAQDTAPTDDAEGVISPLVQAAFSKQIERELAEKGARVAIVFRSGRPADEMPEGVRYTHGAFWVYSTIESEDGRDLRGYAVHNLYNRLDGDPTRSYLKQDFPADFTSTMVEARAGIIVPTPEMQRRLYNLINSPTYSELHQPEYSLIANPHDGRFQNCNEFMLDVISAGVWETEERPQIKANLAKWFEPAPIKSNVFQRIFAPMTDSMLRTSDHSGGIKTTTFGSLAAWMEKYNLATTAYELNYAAEAEEEDA